MRWQLGLEEWVLCQQARETEGPPGGQTWDMLPSFTEKQRVMGWESQVWGQMKGC